MEWWEWESDCDWLRSKLRRKRRDLGVTGGICSVVKRKGERGAAALESEDCVGL